MSVEKKYTASDIERYHSGKLSAAERHALEKAALGDPFLADALEGYALAQTPSADLSALQQRLQLRIDKEEKRHGIFYLKNWMKIAALLVLIAGSGLLVTQVFSDKKETIASKEAPEQKPSSSTKETVADSSALSPAAPMIAQNETREKQHKPQRHATPRKTIPQSPDQVPLSAMSKTKPDSLKDQGYVTQSAAAVPGRLEEVVVKREAEDAFKKQRAALASRDTVNNFNVTLKRAELPPEETVVLVKSKATRQPKRTNIRIDSLEPAEGWTNFDDYIASHLKEPDELKTKALKGEVELSFDVNAEGEPVNITVTKSLCDKCDEEAMRLLKEGPKWKQNKKKGKIKIKFPPQ